MSALRAVLLCLLLASLPAWGVVETYDFDTPAQEQRFRELSEELRCLVCQNENLANSRADLARDLRRQLHEMIVGGASKGEVVDYMVARYGDFVLYRPPVKRTTWLLWFGPALLALLAIAVLVRMVRANARAAEAPLDPAEQSRVNHILSRKPPGD